MGAFRTRRCPAIADWAWFFRSVLPDAACVLAQDETAAARYRELGAERVEAAGNLKYDFDPSAARVAAEVEAFLAAVRPDAVWIAASTMPPETSDDPDEDVVVLDAFESLRQTARAAADDPGAASARALRFRGADCWSSGASLLCAARRLKRAGTLALPGVLLLDTIGELSGLFGRGDVVFMGGTLVHRGGHNILEPAAFGRAVVTGPHMENFSEIAASFREADAVVTVECSGRACAGGGPTAE